MTEISNEKLGYNVTGPWTNYMCVTLSVLGLNFEVSLALHKRLFKLWLMIE